MKIIASSLIAVILFIALNPNSRFFKYPIRIGKHILYYNAILFFVIFYLANSLLYGRGYEGFADKSSTTPGSTITVAAAPSTITVSPSNAPSQGGGGAKTMMFQIKANGNSVPTQDSTGNYQITASDYVDGGGNHTAVKTYNDPTRGPVLFLAHNYLTLNAPTPSSCTRTFWVNIIPPQDPENSFFVPYSSFVMSSQSWSLVLSGNSQNAVDFKKFNVASLPCSLNADTTDKSFDISKMISSEQTRLPGTWYFVACVVTPLHHALYMYTQGANASDGGLVGTNNNMFNCFNGDNGPVLIGARNNVSNFGGYLDDIRQYSYALSEAEIVDIFNNTKK
jgi:Concanavalin A-like lectin/glucanases superfamily